MPTSHNVYLIARRASGRVFHKNHNYECFYTDEPQLTAVLTLPPRFWRISHDDACIQLRNRIQQQYNAQLQVCCSPFYLLLCLCAHCAAAGAMQSLCL